MKRRETSEQAADFARRWLEVFPDDAKRSLERTETLLGLSIAARDAWARYRELVAAGSAGRGEKWSATYTLRKAEREVARLEAQRDVYRQACDNEAVTATSDKEKR